MTSETPTQAMVEEYAFAKDGPRRDLAGIFYGFCVWAGLDVVLFVLVGRDLYADAPFVAPFVWGAIALLIHFLSGFVAGQTARRHGILIGCMTIIGPLNMIGAPYFVSAIFADKGGSPDRLVLPWVAALYFIASFAFVLLGLLLVYPFFYIFFDALGYNPLLVILAVVVSAAGSIVGVNEAKRKIAVTTKTP